MPAYDVTAPGFYGGLLYGPKGKRTLLTTDKPFPSKNGVEQVPSWLKRRSDKPVPKTTSKQKPSATDLKAELTALGVPFKGNASVDTLLELLESHKKAKQDRQDITNASFLADGSSGTVETL